MSNEPTSSESQAPLQAKCSGMRCSIGFVHDYGDSGIINGHDVFDPDSVMPERIRNNKLSVWVFSFCPSCGYPIDKRKVADELGVSLADEAPALA